MAATYDQAPPPKSKGPKRPLSYSEGTDEAPQLLDEESVDVEKSTPADKRTSIESVEKDEENAPPIFEE